MAHTRETDLETAFSEKKREEMRRKTVAGQSYITFGVKRKHGLFFCDLDTKNFDIYETKDGIHIVAKSRHRFFYHGRRLRISPKWDVKGKEVNPAPKLLFCNCPNQKHVDKRKRCKIVAYITRSR